jgi:hypothetical protein
VNMAKNIEVVAHPSRLTTFAPQYEVVDSGSLTLRCEHLRASKGVTQMGVPQ